MGLVLHDAGESIPGPDCSGDGPDTIDYAFQSQSQTRRSQNANNALSAGSSRRSHRSHSSKNHSSKNYSAHSAPSSSEAPRRSGRSRGCATAAPAAAPSFVPPTLMRQDAFCASSLAELHRMGVMGDSAQPRSLQTQIHHHHQTQSHPDIDYSEPVTMTIYELEDGSTQGSTDSSYASQARHAYYARQTNGYDKSKYADWQ